MSSDQALSYFPLLFVEELFFPPKKESYCEVGKMSGAFDLLKPVNGVQTALTVVALLI